MGTKISLHTAAAGEKRTNLHTLPNIAASGSLRAKKPLVAGEAENVDVHGLHVDWHGACGLGCVHHKEGAVVVGDVEPGTVVAGCPARVIKRKDEKTAGKTALVEALREIPGVALVRPVSDEGNTVEVCCDAGADLRLAVSRCVTDCGASILELTPTV